MIKSWASTQTIVSLSSGEAEYYGIVKGTCEAIGLQTLWKDFGDAYAIRMHTDSSAAKAIATRRGVGKVKHLDTRSLWIQDKVDSGAVTAKKVPGTQNPADLCTKYLAAAVLNRLLSQLPVLELTGRHRFAPQLQGTS